MESRGAHCYIFGVDKDKAFEFFLEYPLGYLRTIKSPSRADAVHFGLPAGCNGEKGLFEH